MSRSRAWCFTWNNPGALEPAWECQYIVYQMESGESGTPHWQGYCQFKNAKKLEDVRKLCPSAHWEVRRGTHAQAVAYCTKTESRVAGGAPVTRGVPPMQGSRTDLAKVESLVRSGAPMEEIADSNWEYFVRYHKGLQAARNLFLGKRTYAEGEKPRVIVLTGSSGVGKSRMLSKHFPGCYRKDTTNEWWDHYDGQDTVFFDEFYGGISPNQMIKIIDWYPLAVQYKGGFVELLAKTFIFASNKHISEFWKEEVDVRAFTRRVEEFSEWDGIKHVAHVTMACEVEWTEAKWFPLKDNSLVL